MLTRLEVDGFKNLVNFSLDFGPYTCIAGPNGAGKSNIFDAIRFLSLLTEHTINEAALQTRNAGEETGNIQDLLFLGAGERNSCMRFSAEMIVDKRCVMISVVRLKHRLHFYDMKLLFDMQSLPLRPGFWVDCCWKRKA